MEERFEQFFHQVPPEVDVEEIRRQWLALRSPFLVDNWVLPLPVWGQRGYSETGERAWLTLQQDLSEIPATKPLCIYLHVPFCSSKCGFCDSYSFKLGKDQAQHIDDYVGLLEQEMGLWSRQGNLAQRPVSSVHFGGGTPSFIGVEAFDRLARRLETLFATSSTTEWALESTVTHLGPEMTACLHDSGFRRLHIGVQSLEDPVRQAIGRRQSARQALDQSAKFLNMGWVVSVDLICGLPHQTMVGFLSGIQALVELGVDGFSIYELLIYPQNRKWAERYGLVKRDHLPNYWSFQAGASLLETLGYRKNLFNHWANEMDKNIYFTFPGRGEDLLALGTIADGVFGDYHYRHPTYSHYQCTASERFPALEGGVRRNELENRLHHPTTALLSGHIPRALVFSTTDTPVFSEQLLQSWFETALIKDVPGDENLRLTTNGSWFLGNMVSQLTASHGLTGSS